MNPRWLQPDEHELAVTDFVARYGLAVLLIPSTPEVRRRRARASRVRAEKAIVESRRRALQKVKLPVTLPVAALHAPVVCAASGRSV